MREWRYGRGGGGDERVGRRREEWTRGSKEWEEKGPWVLVSNDSSLLVGMLNTDTHGHLASHAKEKNGEENGEYMRVSLSPSLSPFLSLFFLSRRFAHTLFSPASSVP